MPRNALNLLMRSAHAPEPKPKKRKVQKTCKTTLIQTALTPAVSRVCAECGFLFNPSVEQDQKTHKKIHRETCSPPKLVLESV